MRRQFVAITTLAYRIDADTMQVHRTAADAEPQAGAHAVDGNATVDV